MPIPNGKRRVMITLHEETIKLLEELEALHDNSSKSKIIEIALLFYTKCVMERMDQETKKENDNGKN